MKKILNKIIINFSILFFLGACHTLEHRNILIQNQNLINKEVKNKVIPSNNEIKNKVIPSNKEIKNKIVRNKINLKSLINFSETELYSKIKKGDFIKKEGQLKNIQYYFSKCFLDIFLIKRNNDYYVSFLQTRSTLLNGLINKDECLDEITSKLKTRFN